jgi:hypothetical protein
MQQSEKYGIITASQLQPSQSAVLPRKLPKQWGAFIKRTHAPNHHFIPQPLRC